MKTVIYLDVLLLVNFIVAAALLSGCGLLCSSVCSAPRLVVASAAAAASSLILLAPELPLVVQIAYQAAAAGCIVRIAFYWQGKRTFFRLYLWYWLLNLLLAGLVVLAALQGCRLVQTNNLACYYSISPVLLCACVGGVYVVLRLSELCFGRLFSPQPWQMELFLCGAMLRLPACLDTGFCVKEPMSGQAVVLVYWETVRRSLPTPLRHYLGCALAFPGAAAGIAPPPELQVRLVACHTVAGEALLPAVPVQALALSSPGGSTRQTGLYAAFAGGRPPDARYQALFGMEIAEKIQRREAHAV